MKVELTGITRYFIVTDENSNEYSVCEMYDENTQSVDYEVLEVKTQKELKNKEKIIEAVGNYLSERK